VRAELAVREALVRTRTRDINVIRAALRREGVRVPSGSATTFARRVQALALPPPLTAVVTPLLTVLAPLGRALAAVDARLARHVRTTPAAQRLCTVPGVGPVTAAAFVATLDDVWRFASPAQVTAYVGLVPREYSSGEHQRRGPLTKTGNRRLRSLLVQAAWGYWRSRASRDTPLRHWAARLADRRGRLRAIVALARRLTRVLYALWRHGTVYDPGRLGGRAAA
jgi:transposase